MAKNIVDKNSFYTGKELHNLKVTRLGVSVKDGEPRSLLL